MSETKTSKANSLQEDLSWVLGKPRVTEKSAFLGMQNVYTFDVSPRANKIQIKKAVLEVYGKKAVKVNIITIPQRNVVVRGKRGVRSGGKKAMVFLLAGEMIEF